MYDESNTLINIGLLLSLLLLLLVVVLLQIFKHTHKHYMRMLLQNIVCTFILNTPVSIYFVWAKNKKEAYYYILRMGYFHEAMIIQREIKQICILILSSRKIFH
jgi:ABC-type Fe3+-siderophore transport system permease subunit